MIKLKQYRPSEPYSYAIGVYPVLEVLANQQDKVFHVFLSNDFAKNEGARKIVQLCEKHGISYTLSDHQVQKFTQNDAAHAVGFFYKYEQVLSTTKPHVVLVQPTDMGNAGTILRTMAAFGFADLSLIKPAIDIFSPKTIRASMGEVFRSRVQYFNTLEAYNSQFPLYEKYLFWLDRDAQELSSVKCADQKFSLVFGGEGPGLDHSLAALGKKVYIKQSEKVDSLNLSIAVGIALHQMAQLD